MKPFNKGLKLFSQKMHFAIVPLLIVVTVISCQRTVEPLAETNAFNAEAAKEWYYGTFKKSAEWTSSPLKEKKLPNWSKGVYRKVGQMEIVEFPLIKEQTTISISSDGLLNTANKKRIAEASLTRIVFIKKSNQDIFVREVDYIPDWNYLQKKNFDISHVSVGNSENDFSGRLIVKKWNGNKTASWSFNNGAVTKIKPAKLSDEKNTSRPAVNSSSTGYCFVEVCYYTQQCWAFFAGDEFIRMECGEWELDYCEDVEIDCGDDDDDDPDPCEGLTSEECACLLYGVGCGDGDDEEECNAPSPSEVLDGGSPASEIIESATDPEVTEASGDITRTWKGRWTFYKGNWVGYNWSYKSFDKGVHKKENGVWKWVSMDHVSHSQVGTSPFSTTCTMNDHDGIIDADRLGAKMQLEFEVKVCVTCLGIDFGCSSENESSYIWFPIN